MFRAVVVSVVLAVAAAPSAAQLCKVWCTPQTAATEGCHHTPSAPTSIAADPTCDDPGLADVSFVGGEVRRAVTMAAADQAIPVPHYRIAFSATVSGPGFAPAPQRSLDPQLLLTALRI